MIGLSGVEAGRRRAGLVAFLLAAAVVVSLFLTTTPALAAFNHDEADPAFDAGGDCAQVLDIAVDEVNGYVYTACPNRVKRFNLDGSPAPFGFSASYLSGNAIIANPGAETGLIESPRIAVDNSDSSNKGLLFVGSAPNIDLFKPSGEYAAPFVQPIESSIPNQFDGIDIDPNGFIYVTSHNPGDRVSKYGPGFNELKRLYPSFGFEANQTYGDPVYVAADTTGAVWQSHGPFASSSSTLTKFEADQFTDELSIGFVFGGAQRKLMEPWVATPSPFAPDPLVTVGLRKFDVDFTDNDLYVNLGDRVRTYSAGDAEEPAHKNAPDFGIGTLANSSALAVTLDHHVYASTQGNKVVHFGPGDLVPDVKTLPPDIAEVGHDGATLRGVVDLGGGADVDKCEVRYGLTSSYTGAESGSAKCTPDAEITNYTDTTEVAATVSGLKPGTTYHYTFVAGNPNGENEGIDRTFTPAHVLQVQTLPAEDIDTDGAELKGTLDPDGSPTTYRFQYGLSSSYGLSTDIEEAGSASGVQTVGIPVEGLTSGRVIHYRLVAENASGTTFGPDRTFRVASPPEILSVSSRELTGDTAVLDARINPVGYPTTYRFEYGTTSDYGLSAPIGGTGIGSGMQPVEVSQKLTNLNPGVTYHYRVIAENDWGTQATDDTTFDYAPPSCPNAQVRQLTKASYLPDCRAYEIVSPESAGAVNIWPSDQVIEQCNPFEQHCTWTVNQGWANSPSRFAFFGGLGAIEGINAPTDVQDMYMATRTNTEWVTTLPQLSADLAYRTKRKMCTEKLDLCIDHRAGESGFPNENAAYLVTHDGEILGRLPSNVDEVAGGDQFKGDQVLSEDGSTFVFSSGTSNDGFAGPYPPVVFAPGGKATGNGSVYSNDIASGDIEVISKLPGGIDIPEDEPATDPIKVPAVSPDGSRVLMQTPAAGGGVHLYYHHVITYDITQGEAATLVGMTRDGSRVVFASAAQMTPDDTDSGTDLFVWEESDGGSLTRVSRGNGEGDSDDCSIGLPACSVSVIFPDRAHPGGAFPADQRFVYAPGQDDMLADGSGAFYFFSPENLDPATPGIRNEQNLYLYREGGVQFVTTFEAGTSIRRMQISTDGAHAAFVTDSQLTSYDNNGKDTMYVYDADRDVLRCASCNPAGTPPIFDVIASQGGRFMSDDGRAFFATEEALVPQDGNISVIDVYEYVDGRPQLITSGQGSRDFSGESQLLSFEAAPVFTGLEHVSRDGTDVFFSTFESLVPQDRNGPFIKIYTARTNGGFPVSPQLHSCAAADECHGSDNVAPPAPVISTATNFGDRGNVAPPKPKRTRKGKRKRGKKRCAARKTRAARKRCAAKKRRASRAGARRDGRRNRG